MTIEFWRTLALGSAAVGQTAFVLLYSTFPWWRSFLGRALFYKACTLCVILDVFIVARLLDFGRLDVVFIIMYVALSLGIWFQFFAFLYVKRKGMSSGYKGPDRRMP